MEFSRIGEHTIKCVISEEEIYDLGYTMDEIMSNGERTQEFMNQIFDMAEEEFGIDFNMGIKTVRAVMPFFLPVRANQPGSIRQNGKRLIALARNIKFPYRSALRIQKIEICQPEYEETVLIKSGRK